MLEQDICLTDFVWQRNYKQISSKCSPVLSDTNYMVFFLYSVLTPTLSVLWVPTVCPVMPFSSHTDHQKLVSDFIHLRVHSQETVLTSDINHEFRSHGGLSSLPDSWLQIWNSHRLPHIQEFAKIVYRTLEILYTYIFTITVLLWKVIYIRISQRERWIGRG